MVKAVVGANWGDEGKGKITDMMAADADMHFTHYLQEFFIIIQQVLLETVLHLTSLFSLRKSSL